MIRRDSIEKIKRLIKNGFDIELISFELDIPIEEIRQLKMGMENQGIIHIKRYSYDEIIRNMKAHNKMEKIRGRYRELFYRDNQENNIEIRELSQEELNKINKAISNIQDILEEAKKITEITENKRRKVAAVILEEMKNIQDYQLTIEQIEELNRLLQSEELNRLNLEVDMYIIKKMMIRKLVVAVDIAQSKTNDIDELISLGRKITLQMPIKNQILVGTVKSKIDNKITSLQQQKAIERIRNDVSINILEIIENLSNGTLDVQSANEIINEEARKRVESKPKNRFALSEKQEKEQILIQIRSILSERVDKFDIINPKATILQLQELSGGDLRQSIRAVVKNLMERKKIEIAKTICDEFYYKEEESQIKEYIKGIKMTIRNAEIRDIVLKAINMRGTFEEEKEYLELIEKKIKMGNVKLSGVSLGRSKDGARNITLADIWTDRKNFEIERINS